jgi:LAS superfamily LD-carboxypeptidase LdcB
MRRLPVEPMRMPADLHGVENGKLSSKLLTNILPSGKLHHYAAESWQRLQQQAAFEGLTLTQVGDYRPMSQQEHLFLLRMRKYPDAKRTVQTTRTWNGETWYLHTGAPVATPGTSNHGWGLAIDVALRVNGRAIPITAKPDGAWRTGLKFLRKVAPGLGWSWELQSEPWHIRYVLGRRLG